MELVEVHQSRPGHHSYKKEEERNVDHNILSVEQYKKLSSLERKGI